MYISGNQLKLAINNLGITQQEAADKMEISRQTLTVWLRHESLDDKILSRVKSKLGIALEDVFIDKIAYNDNAKNISNDYLQKIISTQDETIASLKELINNLKEEVGRLKKENADLQRLARTSNAG